MRRCRLLLGALVAVALIAPLLVAAGFAAARASGPTATDSAEDIFLLVGGCVAYLAAVFTAGKTMPESWPAWLQQAATLLAAAGWVLLQLSIALCGLG